jgi:uncharacterized protein (TIGR03086 family)
MNHLDALARAYDRLALLLDDVAPVDYERPTPCDEWDLGQLVGHVVGAAGAFAIVLEGGPTPARARVDVEGATADELRSSAARAIAGWRTPGALERDYDSVIELDGGVLIPPIPLPGSMLLDIHLLDVGVHLHDVAISLDRRELAEDEDVATATLAAAQLILQPGVRELAGFAAETAATADADATTRLLAFVGR